MRPSRPAKPWQLHSCGEDESCSLFSQVLLRVLCLELYLAGTGIGSCISTCTVPCPYIARPPVTASDMEMCSNRATVSNP